MNADPSLVRALDELRSRRHDIERAIEALETLVGDNGTPPSSAAPSPRRRSSVPAVGGGVQGVARVLSAKPGAGFSDEELAEAMIADGWVTESQKPSSAARAAANRLRRMDPRYKLEAGQFVFRPDEPTQLSTAGGFGVQNR